MGVIKRGILGGFSNKVANVVGSSWKGIAVIKSLPLSVANPRTAGQITQRSKMTWAVAFAKLILVSMIKPLNDRFAQQKSGFNLWIQRNISKFQDDNLEVTGTLVLCEGSLTPVAVTTQTSSAAAHTITLTYDDNTGEGDALATDVLYYMAVNTDVGEAAFTIADDRTSSPAVMAIPATWAAGANIVTNWAFRRADGSKVSNSDGGNIILGA
ncbi:MAG: hypothetical protein RLZZ574_153 [Cyanobacteriota bacterium]|jgi:hypothetical protein